MKTQIKFEKIICVVMLLSSALCFIFALGITTDIHKLWYVESYKIKGSELYQNIQPFNKTLVKLSIVSIVLSVFLFITKTNNRRKYYISNYVVTSLCAISNISIAIWAIIKLQYYKNIFLTETDFAGWKEFCEFINEMSYYTESTFWLEISIITFIVLIICSLLLVINLIWKTMLTRYETQLLTNYSKEAQL